MAPHSHVRTGVGLFCAVILAGAAALAQGALGQVGMTEADAHSLVLQHIGPGYLPVDHAAQRRAAAAFRTLPPEARGALATALYAWTKSHVSSPQFRKAYAQQRADNTPVERKHEGTVDQEVQAKVAQLRAESETAVKELLAAGMKEQADQMRKMTETMVASMAGPTRLDVEEARVKDKADHASALKFWQEYYPPDPMTLVAKHLRTYLADTADVDFAARQEERCGEGGCRMAFVNNAYNGKPHAWRVSYEFGPEVLAAGRAAAAAWLKELGAK